MSKNPFEDESYYSDIPNPFEDSANTRLKQKIETFKSETKYKAKSYQDQRIKPVINTNKNPNKYKNFKFENKIQKNKDLTEIQGKNFSKLIIPIAVLIFALISLFSSLPDYHDNYNDDIEPKTVKEYACINDFIETIKAGNQYKDFDMNKASFVNWDDVIYTIQEEQDFSIYDTSNKDYKIMSVYWFDDNNDFEPYKISFILKGEDTKDSSLEGIKIVHRNDNYDIDKEVDLGNTTIPNVNIENYI